MRMDLLCRGRDHRFLKKKKEKERTFLLHCDSNMLVVESTRICGFCPCVHYLLCVLCALFFLSVLMGVWTVTSLATVLVCVCCSRCEVLSSSPEDWLLKMSLVCVRYCGCVIATLFWLLTVSFHWRCMLAVFLCFVPFDALGLSSICMYCSSVSSPLTHPATCFLCSLSSLHTSSAIHPHLSTFPLSSFPQTFPSRMLLHLHCVSPRQPVLVWMHNIKALDFNEQQLFKASFGGMIWLCMFQSF